MNIKSFFQSKITQLVDTFRNIQVRYQFDAICDTYYIEITPNVVFTTNESLKDAQADIYDEFDELFPDASLTFISDKSLNKITKPEIVLTGQDFATLIERNILWFDSITFNLFEGSGIEVENASENNYALAA